MSVYQYSENSDLKILRFPEMSEEWLDFVIACRRGIPHSYDIVEEPMVDDTIFNYLQDFQDKRISREAFWELVKFKHPINQISFHTIRALITLQFEKSYEVT